MDKLCQDMAAGGYPAWEEILTAWGRHFPLLRELAATEQDPVWHGEGNVGLHTAMVLEEIRRAFRRSEPASGLEPDLDLDWETRLTLQLAAIFHDIGKPLTTRRREIGGVERVISPRHAEAGRNYLCLRLAVLGLPREVEQKVLALTAFHHHPRRLVADDAPPARWRLLARQCPPELLFALENADLRGRFCPDLEGQLEIMELFRMRCRELGIWENPDPWAGWREEIDAAFPERPPAFRRHAFEAAVRDAESGVIQSVEEGIARAWQLKNPAPELLLLWGPSGSGKSEWIRRHGGEATVVSLDGLREELAGKRDDQTMNGQVLQAARDRLKRHLRHGERVIFDATNLRRELRGPLLALGVDYGARTGIVALRTPFAELETRNRKREHPVPRAVLERQCSRLEWPEADEAHHLMIAG
ncbi:MAG: AAA family ATPase [Verrucomicrobiota bacterium]